MKKILILALMSLLFFVVACDDTSDSPQLSETEALNNNNTVFNEVLRLFKDEYPKGLDKDDYTFEVDQATHKITGTMKEESNGDFTVDMKITMTEYPISTITVTEASIEYDVTLTSGKFSGKLTGNYRYTYKENPYKCSWNFEIENDRYTGEYDMNGDKYTFDYTDLRKNQ